MSDLWRDNGDGTYQRLYRTLTQEQLCELIQDAQFYKWRWMGLNDTGINSLPDSISELTYLRTLNLSGTYFTTFPQAILSLKNLQELDISDTLITALPDNIDNLTNLRGLDLHNTGISALPASFEYLKFLRRLYLHGTPVYEEIPPEIRSQTVAEITHYVIQMLSSSASHQFFNESKMVVVGQGFVGKSCVINRLIHKKYENQHTTEGIDIEQWNFKNKNGERYTLNVWDFGGQEIYHATHQFFLTKRMLYILVWDAFTEDEYGRVDYWLRTIRSLAGDSPVIIAVNKCDRDVGRHRYIENAVLDRYPQIQKVFYISCKDGIGISDLRDFVLSQAETLPLMKTRWLYKWLTIRQELEELAKTENYIYYSRYLSICGDKDMDEAEASSLAQYLHDLGVVLYYHEDPLLRNIVILSPKWGTDAVYKVLDQQERVLKGRNGLLHYSDLPGIWKNRALYPWELYPYLMNLMENFQLAFKIHPEQNNRSPLLVAELLNVDPVDREWPAGEETLAFRYAYDFLPAGVMTRLIVSIHEYLEDVDGVKQCWRKGAYLCHRTARARVELYDGIDRKYLDVRIIGDSRRDRQELLTIVRAHVKKVNSRFQNIEITELVPCRCSPGCRYFFRYETLLKAEKMKIEKLRCDDTLTEVSVAGLLDGVRGTKAEQRIFISYRHQDRDRVFPVVELLERRGYRVWLDRDITAGDTWTEALAEQITDCGVFLPFLSHAYAHSDNCKDELRHARSRHRHIVTMWLDEKDALLEEVPFLLGNAQGFSLQTSLPEDFIRWADRQAAFQLCRDAVVKEYD